MKKTANEELGRPSPEEFAAMPKMKVTVILDNIRSLNNIGSVFRTCDAFAVEKVILCGITACPPNREIHKTALGAESTVNWKYMEKTVDAVMAFREQGCKVIAVEQAQGAVLLQDCEFSAGQKYALVFGNEVAGVSQEVMDLCDGAIEIPQSGTKHSLNVAVSAGVVLWHFYSRLLL